MVDYSIHEALENLADRYIPEGKHHLLHVDSREMWKELMIKLLQKEAIPSKISFITKCAISWESLLVHRLSPLN